MLPGPPWLELSFSKRRINRLQVTKNFFPSPFLSFSLSSFRILFLVFRMTAEKASKQANIFF